MEVSKAFTKFGLACAVFFAQQSFAEEYEFQYTNSENILTSRYQECGGRKIEKRIISYQGDNFGIDFGADKKSFLTFRYGGQARNTEKGFSFLSCNTDRKARWDRKKQKKEEERARRIASRDYTPLRSVVLLPEKDLRRFGPVETNLGTIRDRQAAEILAALREKQKQEEVETVPTEPMLAQSVAQHTLDK